MRHLHSETIVELLGQVKFRPMLVGFLLKLAVLLATAFSLLWLALAYHPFWWGGVALSGLSMLVVAQRFACCEVVLHGADIILRQGWPFTTEIMIPLYAGGIEIRQDWLGRLLGYGSVMHVHHGKRIELRYITRIQRLRYLLVKRRMLILSLLVPQRRHKPQDWELV